MDLAQGDSEIHCVFICCDLPYQYLDDYFVKLGESYFHPIQNSVSNHLLLTITACYTMFFISTIITLA